MDSEEPVQLDNGHSKCYNWITKANTYLESKFTKEYNWNKILIIAFIVLLAINFARLFYNNFWWDECYSILKVNELSYSGLLENAEYGDVSPPLYLFMLKFFCSIFGYNTFVYCFTSYIPYVILMILAATYIRKTIGIKAAVMIMLFASIIQQPQYYITEVRCYEWSLLFIFIIFILAYEIIKSPKVIHYLILTPVYICACYIHYYPLMGGGLIILGLIIRAAVIKDRKGFLLTSASLLIAILAYIPWITFMLGQVKAVTEDFWITGTPTIIDCFLMFFGYNPVSYVFMFFVVITIIFLLRKFNVIKKGDDFLSLFQMDSDKWWLVVIGLFSITGVVIVVTIFSLLKQPIFFLKYTFSFAAIAWIILALFVSEVKPKKLFVVLVFGFTLCLSGPWCCGFMCYEYYLNAETVDTLNVTYPYMTEDSEILTDVYALTTDQGTYYFPGITIEELDPNALILNPGIDYWLFLNRGISDDLKNKIAEQGYNCDLVKAHGRNGPDIVWVYRLS